MPIYKMEGKKNGKQKYRVRINYIDSFGKAKQKRNSCQENRDGLLYGGGI